MSEKLPQAVAEIPWRHNLAFKSVATYFPGTRRATLALDNYGYQRCCWSEWKTTCVWMQPFERV